MTEDGERWQRIGLIFDEVADADPANRATLLDRLCAGDTTLHAEVVAMLRADASAEEFDSDVGAVRAQAVRAWSDDADSITSGERVGPWQLLSELGRGGMGIVFLAERADGQFEQHAALKLIKRGMDSDAVIARFLRERQILAQLAHPHIARLLDGGIAADGRPYFAMEYIDGQTLLRYCEDKNIKLDGRLALFLGVCSALEFAHARLIVHRDIKPSNILVTDDGAAKLLDFGIAKLLGAEGAAANATAFGVNRPLTPAYAAPEQLRGETVTIATDVYSLGCVLYELLSDKRAHDFDETTTFEQARRIVETDSPIAPSRAVDAGSAVSSKQLVGDLDTIVLKAMHRDPSRRYPTVEALAGDLRRHLQGMPISARREDAGYRLRKFIGRHRVGVAAGVAMVAILLLATAASLYEAEVARSQTQQARAQSARAQATHEFLVGIFDQVSPDANQKRPITARQLLDIGAHQVDKNSEYTSAAQAELLALLGRLYRDIGDRPLGSKLIDRALAQINAADVPPDVRAGVLFSAAETESEDKETYAIALAHAREGLTLLESSPDADPRALASGHFRIAYALRHLGSNAEAVSVTREAIVKDGRALGDDDAVAEEWVQLGIALSSLNRYAESGAAFDAALAIYRKLHGNDSIHVSHALDAKGGMLTDHRDFAEAETALREASRIAALRLDPGDHDTLVIRNNLLHALESRGKFNEALLGRLELLERGKMSTQLTSTDLANDYLAAGIDYVETSAFTEGERSFREALSILREKPGVHSLWYAFALEFLGYVLPWEGRFGEAESAFQDALAITLESGPATSDSACRLRDSLSWVMNLQGHNDKALALARQVNAECTEKLPDQSQQRPTFLADLSAAQLSDGGVAAAAVTAENALRVARQVYPQAYYRLGIALLALARANLALERADAAEPLLREALSVRSPPYAADDPRVLEVEVELVIALNMNNKHAEAEMLRARIEPVLKQSDSLYQRTLLTRLQQG